MYTPQPPPSAMPPAKLQPPELPPAKPNMITPHVLPSVVPMPRMPQPSVRPAASQFPRPAQKGTIKKGDPKYTEIIQKAFKAADYALNEILFKNGPEAKAFVVESLNLINQLDF